VTLRPYQVDAVRLVREAWAAGRRPILVLPTGAGKTVVARELAEGGALVVAHTRQIVEQTARRFAPCGVLMGDATRDTDAQVVVASVQTLARRPLQRRVLIVDEAHHATSPSYLALVQSAERVVGLTATPERLDGRGLASAGFDALLEPATFAQLAAHGWLAVPQVYGVPARPAAGSLRVVAGDWTAASAAESMRALDGSVPEHWQRHARGRRCVLFAATVEHARSLAERLRAVGARFEAVSGADPPERRAEVLGRLADGRLDGVANCALLSEGWDLPALDCAVLARPTRSLTVHLQQVGRVTRPAPGKPASIVLDHAGNTRLHGFVDDPRPWSLDGRQRARETATVVLCPGCLAYYARSLAACPACGRVEPRRPPMPVPPRPESDARLVALARSDVPHPADVARAAAPGDGDAALYARFVFTAWSRGHRIGSAWHKFRAVRKREPDRGWRDAIEAAYRPHLR
jgi:superfamily II DNA or RNA helicase